MSAVDGDCSAHVEPFERHVRGVAALLLNAHAPMCPICILRGVRGPRGCELGATLMRIAESGRATNNAPGVGENER